MYLSKQDNRFQVFVSSTSDLSDARKAVVECVCERPLCNVLKVHLPEQHHYLDLSLKDKLEHGIQTSELFILILGAAYGSVYDDRPVDDLGHESYVEWEFKCATEYKNVQGRPSILAYLTKVPILDERQKIFVGKVKHWEKGKDCKEFESLDKFINDLTVCRRTIRFPISGGFSSPYRAQHLGLWPNNRLKEVVFMAKLTSPTHCLDKY